MILNKLYSPRSAFKGIAICRCVIDMCNAGSGFHWFSNSAKSAAMPAENARPFMSSPSAQPTGSSLFPRIPVDLHGSWPSTCLAVFPRVRPDAPPPYSFRLAKSNRASSLQAISVIPRALQLAPASLAATTGVKSAAYPTGRLRFTESLASFRFFSFFSLSLAATGTL